MRALVWAALAPAALVFAQDPPPLVLENQPAPPAMHKGAHAKASKSGALARRIRSIEIKGGWAGKVVLPLAVCEVLTTQRISAAMHALEAAVAGGSSAIDSALASEGEVEILLIDVDYDTSAGVGSECGGAPTVGIAFNPYHLRLSLSRVGDNVLPLPRSPLATPNGGLPPALEVLRPRAGLSHDRSFGTSVDAAIDPRWSNFDASAFGSKSLDAHYYRTGARLAYRWLLKGTALRELRLAGSGEASEEPLAGTETAHHAADLGAGLTFRLTSATPVFLDSAWRRARDQIEATESASATSDRTESITTRALLDTLIGHTRGFARAAVWQDNSRIEATDQSFSRLVGRVGYAQELRLAPNQALGVEVVAGAGRLRGDAPAANRFYGGNSPVQFLYDNPVSQQMLAMPQGPLIRSLGQKQAALGDPASSRGGTSFWHVNLNLAFPIRSLSRPLIPDEEAFEDVDGKPVTLKQVLRNAVNVSGPALMEAALKEQGMSTADARKEAQAALAEIRPAVDYIVDDANLYAIRPLLMIDAAGLAGGLNGNSGHWLAVGAGIGVTVVTARLEAGYMQTISGPEFEPRSGSFFMRLVFHRLF